MKPLYLSATPSLLTLNEVNWPETFPYRPDVSLTASHDGSELHLHFRVAEKAVRAVCAADREHAWEDSCVEFFFAPREDGMYYNLECTCTGKIYLCCGPDRHDRAFLPQEAYDAVRRSASLGEEPFGLLDKPAEWEVRLDIPASVFGLGSFNGLHARGNFYKCGDGLPERHFVSWAPIGTPKPDFHRPEFFGEIVFEEV